MTPTHIIIIIVIMITETVHYPMNGYQKQNGTFRNSIYMVHTASDVRVRAERNYSIVASLDDVEVSQNDFVVLCITRAVQSALFFSSLSASTLLKKCKKK
jgi:hypothetical protein